jgi:anaerobic sulfite reductase subunit C
MTRHAIDSAALRKTGMIQQKQKEYFVMRLHSIAGDFTSEQLKAIADVAGRYGNGQVHLSTRQGIEIHFVPYDNLAPARAELEATGVTMGACGPRVRIIAGCPGSATCKFGIIETKEIARHLDAHHFRQETPYKFKMAVTGCPHNCAKATENDIGVMGGLEPVWLKALCKDCKLCANNCPRQAISRVKDEYIRDATKCFNCSVCTTSCPTGAWRALRHGYTLWLGGTMGKNPRFATKVQGLMETKKELYRTIDKAIDWYRKHGRKKERFGHTLDRYGLENTVRQITNGEGT